MATKKPQVLLTLSDELKDRIDSFWHEERIISRSEAIRRLIQDALEQYEKKRESHSADNREK